MAADAFEQLYLDERVGLTRVAYLITGSAEMAEDAFHEAISRVRPRLPTLERPGAYLRVAVVNEARRMAKKARRATPTGIGADHGAASLDTRQLEIWSALGRLTGRRRTALVLRYYLDLSTAEIAEAMDCRPGTVSSLLHRGLADLRKGLADE